MSELSAQNLNQATQDRLERDVSRENRARGQSERDRTDELLQNNDSSGNRLGEIIDPLAPTPGGPCFTIKKINLTGFEQLGTVPKGLEGLVGKCVTAADIGAALNSVNKFYQKRGHITTRAYVPEQNLSDGVLEVTIIPGRVEGYIYGDGRQADLRIKAAFPPEPGDVLNIREIEQGLDNINGPKSVNGKFQLIPGETPGGSFIQVNIQESKPWSITATANNTGFDTTGEIKANLNVGIDNILNMSDRFSFGIGSTPFEGRSYKYSDSIYANWKVPYKNWLFGIDGGASRYFFVLPGINQSFPIEGNSRNLTFFAERLLMRDQTRKWYGYGSLKLTRSRTFIDGFEIESQRRNLSIGTVGLRGENIFEVGKLYWDFKYNFGLDVFNSYVFDKSIVDPEFQAVSASLTYETPLGPNGLNYRGVIGAKFSDDVLPGSEQFSIGGWSNIRGFHEDNMYGETGVYLQNTIEWNFYTGSNVEIKLNVGLDIGYVEPSTLRSWSQDHLIGASFGTEIKLFENAKLDLRVGRALSRPEYSPPNSQPAFEDGRTVGYLGFTVEF